MPINDHRRRHSRHHSNLSLGALSFKSLDHIEDESEEPQDRGHGRKASLPDFSYSLGWSMSMDTSLLGLEDADEEQEEEEEAEDDRQGQDVRQRLMSQDGTGRERLLSDDGTLASATKTSTFKNIYEPEDHRLSQDIGFEVELFEEPAPTAAASPSTTRPISCFRGIVASCPEMPSFDDGDLKQECGERVDLVLRRARAFSEDSADIYRRATSMDLSNSSMGVRVRYGRRDSMLIDSKYGGVEAVADQVASTFTESPTATWLYWEENLENPTPISPFAEAFRDPQF